MVEEQYAEAKRRGYISEVSFLVDKKLKFEDYVEVWPEAGWYRLKKWVIVSGAAEKLKKVNG